MHIEQFDTVELDVVLRMLRKIDAFEKLFNFFFFVNFYFDLTGQFYANFFNI